MKTNLQFVNCTLCESNNSETITIQNGFNIVGCKACGLVYVNPRPSPEALPEMYNTYHTRDSKKPESWAYLMKENFRHAAEILNKTFPETNTLHKRKLLDIGCGYGYFLDIMKNHGWDASGIDPSANTVAIAQDRGLNVIQKTIEEIDCPENSFDAVTMFYVLEHLTDPHNALKKAFTILKPDGMLILRVPHTTPIVRFLSLLGIKNNLYDPPFHLYDFSPQTITMLLEKSGFSSVNISPGRSTSPHALLEKTAALLFTGLARIIYTITLGSLLIPGISKTVVAYK